METKNIHTDTNWLLFYMNDNDLQVKTLIECQKNKIEQLNDIIKKIKSRIDNMDIYAEDTDEYVSVVNEFEKITNDIPEVKVSNGIFEWVG